MMAVRFKHLIIALTALLSLASCDHDEPVDPIKSVSERTLLIMDVKGNIHDVNGKLIKTLPDCQVATHIIVVDGDYFVSGVNSKQKVGYWKNGKWKTLHVDFIDDVDHRTVGIAKWDYNIYLLDYPNVLRNSGIFRLKDCENFTPAIHGISVSEGKCYVVGTENMPTGDYGFKYMPVLYTERKGAYEKSYLPLPAGCDMGQCQSIYAYDRTHYVAGGSAGSLAAIWEDGVVYTLPRLFDFAIPADNRGMISRVYAVAKHDSHIYAAGIEYGEDHSPVTVYWVDGVPQKLVHSTAEHIISNVADMEVYGDDVYILSQESPRSTSSGNYEVTSVIWMNGEYLASFLGEVSSIAVY